MENWYSACGREMVHHKAAVRGVSLNSTWQSDLNAYTNSEAVHDSYFDYILDVCNGLNGAVSISSTQFAGCLASHEDYELTARLQVAVLLLIGLSLSMIGGMTYMRASCCGRRGKIVQAGKDARGKQVPQRRPTATGAAALQAGYERTLLRSSTQAHENMSSVLSSGSQRLLGRRNSGAKQTLNPIRLPAIGTSRHSSDTATLMSPHRKTPVYWLFAWGTVRFLSSLYLFLWAGVIGISLQILAPKHRVDGMLWIAASSLATNTKDAPLLELLALVALGLFGLLVPVVSITCLRGRANHVLDKQHHASVIVAILTAGYRLQLTQAEAEAVVRRNLGTTNDRDFDDAAHIASMARSISERMEKRCCGLVHWVPSHSFAMVRQLQMVIVLSALWLSFDSTVRAAAIVFALLSSATITILVKPYALEELNTLDIMACFAVVLHTCTAALDLWQTLFWAVWSVHGLTTFAILFCVLRGISKRLRRLFAQVNNWLQSKLPSLPQRTRATSRNPSFPDPFTPDDVAGSRLPSLFDIGRALGVQLGLVAASTRPVAAHSVEVTWNSFTATAQRVLASARAGHECHSHHLLCMLNSLSGEPTNAVSADQMSLVFGIQRQVREARQQRAEQHKQLMLMNQPRDLSLSQTNSRRHNMKKTQQGAPGVFGQRRRQSAAVTFVPVLHMSSPGDSRSKRTNSEATDNIGLGKAPHPETAVDVKDKSHAGTTSVDILRRGRQILAKDRQRAPSHYKRNARSSSAARASTGWRGGSPQQVTVHNFIGQDVQGMPLHANQGTRRKKKHQRSIFKFT